MWISGELPAAAADGAAAAADSAPFLRLPWISDELPDDSARLRRARGAPRGDMPPGSLAALGYEFRQTAEGLTRLFHLPTGALLTAHNWRIFMGGDYGAAAEAAMDEIHRRLLAEPGLGLVWHELPAQPEAGGEASFARARRASGGAGGGPLPPPPPSGRARGVRVRVLGSADLRTNGRALLVLMPGSGSVRAAIWGRQLCVADCIEHGSAVRYIRAAVSRGWAVVCFDPNRKGPSGEPYDNGPKGAAHCAHAWRAMVAGASPARRVAVVAHSAAGSWLLGCLAPECTPDAQLGRVCALAFCDSIHTMAAARLDARRCALLKERGRHWRAGSGELDEPMEDDRAPPGAPELGCGCACVRAGTTDHASVCYVIFDSVWAFLDERMERARADAAEAAEGAPAPADEPTPADAQRPGCVHQ